MREGRRLQARKAGRAQTLIEKLQAKGGATKLLVKKETERGIRRKRMEEEKWRRRS
jgi:hypothetical protein